MTTLPLGSQEDSRLEFKSAEALRNPDVIARGVTALLNSQGGELWIGIREAGGRAAMVEGIIDAERERRRLLDALVDSIEPPPSGEEIRVEVVSEGGADVLCLRATPRPENHPYAYLKAGGRHYVVRAGDRVRPMTREEILRPAPAQAAGEISGVREAREAVVEERRSAQATGEKLLWLRLQPAFVLSLDLQDSRYEDYLRDPVRTGNRPDGWNFSLFSHRPHLEGDRLVTDPDDWRRVEIREDGGLLFQVPLDALHWKGEERELWPPILLEYPVSAFRFAARVYEGHLPPKERVVAELALFGLEGWTLRPGMPGRWPLSSGHPFTESRDLVWERPLLFAASEVVSEPDRCAYRHLVRLYQAFRFRREQIPELFDPDGRLVLGG